MILSCLLPNYIWVTIHNNLRFGFYPKQIPFLLWITLWSFHMAIISCPMKVDDLPIQHGHFPHFRKLLDCQQGITLQPPDIDAFPSTIPCFSHIFPWKTWFPTCSICWGTQLWTPQRARSFCTWTPRRRGWWSTSFGYWIAALVQNVARLPLRLPHPFSPLPILRTSQKSGSAPKVVKSQNAMYSHRKPRRGSP